MFRLSLATGWDVDELLGWEMWRLQEWAAFYQLEPFGMEWLQSAQTTCAIANTAPRKKGSKPFKIEQFLPVKKQQTPEQLKAALMAWGNVAKARINKEKNGRKTTGNVVRDSSHSEKHRNSSHRTNGTSQ